MGGAHVWKSKIENQQKLNVGMLRISREHCRAKISRCILAVVEEDVGCLNNMIAHNLG